MSDHHVLTTAIAGVRLAQQALLLMPWRVAGGGIFDGVGPPQGDVRRMALGSRVTVRFSPGCSDVSESALQTFPSAHPRKLEFRSGCHAAPGRPPAVRTNPFRQRRRYNAGPIAAS